MVKLGFDQDSNGHKKSKKNKKIKKPKHIVYLCHIVSIQVDELTRFGHIQTTQIMYLPPNPKLCLMKSSMHEEKSWFLVSNMEISKTLPRASFWSD